MTSLPVDFKDSVLNSEMGGARRYHVVKNADGTYSFFDATAYDQLGDSFGVDMDYSSMRNICVK